MGKGSRNKNARKTTSADTAPACADLSEEVPALDDHYDISLQWLESALDTEDGRASAKAMAAANVHAQLALISGLREISEKIDGLATRAIGDIDKLTELVQDLEHEARFAGPV